MTRFTNCRRLLRLAAVTALVLTTAAPALAGNTAFSIVNNSSRSIWFVYVSPSHDSDWGDDMLGSGVIMPGERRRIAPGNDRGCFFDVRVVYLNDESETRFDQNLCAISEMVFTGSGARLVNTTFDIVNRSSQSIWYLYVTPNGVGNWGDDWLGDDVLHSGTRFRVEPGPANGCIYDVRVVYANSRAEERRAQNLCATRELVF